MTDNAWRGSVQRKELSPAELRAWRAAVDECFALAQMARSLDDYMSELMKLHDEAKEAKS